jgi:hypothetical protein
LCLFLQNAIEVLDSELHFEFVVGVLAQEGHEVVGIHIFKPIVIEWINEQPDDFKREAGAR